MQKITTCLWFDNQAEEAADFYVSVFKNSKTGNVSRYDSDEMSKVSGQPKGSVMVKTFEIEGREFIALNGGPQFKFTEAISLIVNCDDQKEVDYFWNALTADGGQESMCGWLKDKYGLSWQITPKMLTNVMGDKDKERSQRVMHAMLQMKKIDIQKLQDAYDGK